MKKSSLKSVSAGDRVFDAVLYFFFFIFAILVVYPFWDTIMLSFANPLTAMRLNINLWNDEWSLSSYRYLLTRDGRVVTGYINTIIRTATVTFAMMVTTMLGAYPLSKRNLPGRTYITFFFLIPMFFSGGLIPSYLLMRNLHLINTRWALILPNIFGIFNMIIMRNYLMSLDSALEEAAFIEGANYAQIITRIIVPLSSPVIATIALWTAVGQWNSWFDALIYIQSNHLKVLQTLLRDMVADTVSNNTNEAASLAQFNKLNERKISGPTVSSAMIVLTIGPIVVMYPFLQKYFVKGIMIGSLKG